MCTNKVTVATQSHNLISQCESHRRKYQLDHVLPHSL